MESECSGDICGTLAVSATITKSILCMEHLVLRTSKFHSPMADTNPAPARDECVLILLPGHEDLHSHCPLQPQPNPWVERGFDRCFWAVFWSLALCSLLRVGLWADETWNPWKRWAWSEAMWCEGLRYKLRMDRTATETNLSAPGASKLDGPF